MHENDIGMDLPQKLSNACAERSITHIEPSLEKSHFHSIQAGQQIIPVIGKTFQFGIEEHDGKVVLLRHPVEDVDPPRGQILEKINSAFQRLIHRFPEESVPVEKRRC